jgi:hypothetical protein
MTERLRAYSVAIVYARHIEVQRLELRYSDAGTPEVASVARSIYPDWPSLLRRRKPWAQPGPFKIVRAWQGYVPHVVSAPHEADCPCAMCRRYRGEGPSA